MWSSWVFAAASSPGRFSVRWARAAISRQWVSLSGTISPSRLSVVVCAIPTSVTQEVRLALYGRRFQFQSSTNLSMKSFFPSVGDIEKSEFTAIPVFWTAQSAIPYSSSRPAMKRAPSSASA